MSDSGRRRVPAAAVWVIAGYALIAVTCVQIFPHFVSPNEMSRWALTASLVEKQSVEVGWLLPLLGGRLEDLSRAGDRFYSNKAPALSFLAVPAYVVARPLVGPPSAAALRWSLYATRLLGATLPLLALALALAHVVGRRLGRPERAEPVVFALLFATPLFAYGMLFFSHAFSAAALFLSWLLLFLAAPRRRNDVAAGLLLGLAVASEYPLLVPAVVLAVAAVVPANAARLLRITAGALPSVVLLLLYQKTAFGGYFELSSGHERLPEFEQLARRGLFGVSLPSPSILLRLLFDPSKGLFVFSPVLLLAVPGFLRARAALSRRAWWTLLLVPVALVFVYSGYPNWHGGWTVGARYLVPVMPFLVLPLVWVGRTALEALLLGMSAAAVVTTSIVFPFVPESFPLPWATFALPFLEQGLVAPSLLHAAHRWLAVALPLLAVAAAATVVARRARTMAIVIAGVLLYLGAAWSIRPLIVTPLLELQLTYVEEVYFEQAGAIERRFPGIVLPERLERRREAELRLPPASWKF